MTISHVLYVYCIVDPLHRVYRVPEFLAGHQNWLPPPAHPLTRKRVLPPTFLVPGGDTHAGVRGANSDEGTCSHYGTLYTYPFSLTHFISEGPTNIHI
jgi:hypothetical protein